MAEAVIPSPMSRTLIPTGAPSEVPRDQTKPMVVIPPGQDVAMAQDSDKLDMVLSAVQGLGNAADKMARFIDKQPPGQRNVLITACLVAVMASLFFSTVAAIAAVWVHDTETRGRLDTRLDKQDQAMVTMTQSLRDQADASKAQAKDQHDLVEVVEGLLDEHEAQSEWMPRALEAGFARETIPRMPSSVAKLRRKMPPP